KVFGEKNPELTATVTGTLGEDTVKYDVVREAGENVGKYTITASGKAEQGNYSVTYVAGTLTITSQSIDPGTDPEKPNPDYTGAKVNSPSDKVYDGKEHKWIPTVTDKADKKLEAGKDYTVEYSTKNFKDVGTIEVTITGKGNYTGTVKCSYKVTPKEYTVTTDSATKTYSGTALTAGGKVEGIVYGETVEFTTTGSQTEVGTSKNTYELVWKSAKATNYTLAKESIGELTVKAKSIVPDDSDKTGITVNEPSDSKYDGKEHKEVLTVTDTKTGKELVAGTDYSVTYSSDLVNAGTVKVTVAGLGNYSGSFTKTYKITKRSVTLTSATVSKVYDGSALTNTSITVSGDGFVEGEGASYEVTGSQTVVGNSANSFEYKLNENTLASNYNITKVVGTLTITAAPAPVTPATPSTPSSTTSTTPRTPSAPQVTTPAETVEKETTPKAEPKKEEKVEEEYTPKASPQYYWALINLICAILTVLFGLLLLISKRHKDEDDDEEDETKQQTNNDDEEKEQEKKRGLFTRVLAVLIAIVSVVFFLVTEDLSLPWTWTDQWTIWMVVIGLVQIVVFFVGRKWKNVDNDDEDEEAQQA
uniref:MBG domain-containing protein n=1 Tax=Holdemanella porci TaxID=2652276 RepID=UPI003AB421A0